MNYPPVWDSLPYERSPNDYHYAVFQGTAHIVVAVGTVFIHEDHEEYAALIEEYGCSVHDYDRFDRRYICHPFRIEVQTLCGLVDTTAVYRFRRESDLEHRSRQTHLHAGSGLTTIPSYECSRCFTGERRLLKGPFVPSMPYSVLPRMPSTSLHRARRQP